jgi:hypothetical protein
LDEKATLFSFVVISLSPGRGFAQKAGFGLVYYIFNDMQISILHSILNVWAKPPGGGGP